MGLRVQNGVDLKRTNYNYGDLKKQCCCQKTWGLLRFLGQNIHATNSVITTTFTSYFYQYSRLPPIFSMGRSHIIDHYRTIRRLFTAGTRLHSHLNVSHFITVSKPDRSLHARYFYLHFTTLSVVDNFGSSFGLFSDISSQIGVDSLWNCSR